ncbi:MAG: bifunctional enoyl-CoA hydratase/phosphate acetyltransferase [Rhodospirillaceae bacterium]|jgi:phosphate acetyltransferase|nr:bifunctional enoyl-CoA hydratase/phosphate acetyltransferase [Rhodospirillaceae bacterium]
MLSSVPFEIPAYLLDRVRNLETVRMAVAGADHPVALESARQAARSGLIDPVLVGDAEAIQAIAREAEWDISGYQLVDAAGEDKAPAAAVALARSGEVATLMKGHVHTDALMKAVVNRDAGLRTGRRLSHVFHMTVPNSERVLLITDGAVNVAPDTATKIDIINNAVQLSHALGNTKPHVAMLSGTESVINAMPSSVDAAEVVRRANSGEVTGAVIDGPFAFDNAVSPEAALLKGIDSPVAGNADVLVVPNIETGNGLFKMMVYFMSGLAAGVVMGAKVPIVLTSRADPPEARFAAAAIAALAAADDV